MTREKKREPVEITRNIYRVSGPDITDPRDCASYLLDLGELVLIDAGAGMKLERLVGNIEKLGYDPARISTLILTHCHFDHMGGAVKLRELTGCRLVMHNLDAELVEAGDQRLTAAFCFKVFLEPFSIDLKLHHEEEQLRIGGHTLTCLHTPGHTPGSISVVTEMDGRKILFAQDIGAPLLAEFDCNPFAWVESVEKLYALQADMLCDGHSGAYEPDTAVREYLKYCIRSQYEQGYLPVQG
jgi:glyoxylase-like metal-dependent hydrolase (beta-lactamase superfamily II)